MGSSIDNSILLKEQSLIKKLFPYAMYAFLPMALLHFYFLNPYSFHNTHQFPPTNHISIPTSPLSAFPLPSQDFVREKIDVCDYSNGKWVKSKMDPLYNGTSCGTIKQGQNCEVFGRPDTDYFHWRWKPKACNLPRFEPKTFLELLKNKHIAFVGDSLARNQLESLLCMISSVSRPNLYYTDGEDNKFRKWHFPSHNINVSIYWSPFLVKGVEKNSNGSNLNFNTLYLDSVDERWAGDLRYIDMLVLSVGHWYLHRAVYNYGGSVLGCHYQENCTEIGFYDVFGTALNTAFQTVIDRKGFDGIGEKNVFSLFLTTFSPAHFEGEWDQFGACSKTQPFEENEKNLEGMDEEMRRIGMGQVKEAKLRGEGKGVRVEGLDITRLALMRPDGHPGPYMNPFPFANGIGEKVQNDCVHWCLPGPIDTWNEILLDVIKRWESSEYKGNT